MSLTYQAVGWNHQKKVYDSLLAAGLVLYLSLFVGLGRLIHANATMETLLIRALGTAAFLLLHVILSMGPLCRLDRRASVGDQFPAGRRARRGRNRGQRSPRVGSPGREAEGQKPSGASRVRAGMPGGEHTGEARADHFVPRRAHRGVQVRWPDLGRLQCVPASERPLGEGKIIDGCITCPWHGYQYLPDTGASPPPFTEKVSTFRTMVVANQVFVNPRPLPRGREWSLRWWNMRSESEFFVGYLPMPPGLKKVVARVLAGVGVVVTAAAVVLVAGQHPFAESTFEFQQYRDFEGVLRRSPYAALSVPDGGASLAAGAAGKTWRGRRGPRSRRPAGKAEGGPRLSGQRSDDRTPARFPRAGSR